MLREENDTSIKEEHVKILYYFLNISIYVEENISITLVILVVEPEENQNQNCLNVM